MKKHKTTIIIAVTVVFAISMIWWSKTNQTTSPAALDGEILSLTGLHSHPQLEIYVKGEKQEIPAGLGMGGGHKPIHTHDDAPIVHLEFPAKVTKDDTRLGEFFTVWGKDFREFGQTATMTVNGEPNTEFENYQMKDGDKIELRYD